jgi:tetratricopeptide (TPR) repeat protein
MSATRRAAALLLAALLPVFLYADDFSDGKAAFSANRPADAIPFFEKALAAQNPHPEIYNYLGLSYYQTGDFSKSLDIFERGLTAPGADRRVLSYNAGNTAFALEDYKKADEYFSQAIQADANFADAVLNRANARVSGGQWDGGADDYLRYLELTPDSPQREAILEMIAKVRAQAEEERRLAALKAVSEQRRMELMREIASGLQPIRRDAAPVAPETPALE